MLAQRQPHPDPPRQPVTAAANRLRCAAPLQMPGGLSCSPRHSMSLEPHRCPPRPLPDLNTHLPQKCSMRAKSRGGRKSARPTQAKCRGTRVASIRQVGERHQAAAVSHMHGVDAETRHALMAWQQVHASVHASACAQRYFCMLPSPRCPSALGWGGRAGGMHGR